MADTNGKRLLPPGAGRKPEWDEKDEIIMAAERGDVDTLVSMSHRGIDVMAARSVSEVTLLHIATNYGHFKLIQVLLSSGAPIDAVDSNHWTALHVAAWRGKSKCIQVLCDSGATVDAKCKEGRTPLHIAASNNYSKAVETLYNAGATVDIPDKYGHTALTEAVRQDHGATVMVLINKCKANRSDVAIWYQTKLWQVLKKEEERIKALANEDTHRQSTECTQQEVQPAPKENHLPSQIDSNSLPRDDIHENGQLRDVNQGNFANTLLGGITWTALTCSAGVIGYVIIDEDAGVFTGTLCAIVTGVVCIDVLQWGSRIFR